MVRMLTYLLEQYYQNNERTNHFIVAFFQRMRAFDLDKANSRRGRRRRLDDMSDEDEDQVSQAHQVLGKK